MNIIFDIGNVLVRWDPVEIVRSVINAPGAVRVAEHLFAHPDWLEVDAENLKGTVKELPSREAIDVPVDEMLIVELYSK